MCLHESTSPTLGYAAILNITITIGSGFEQLQMVGVSIFQGKFTVFYVQGIMLCMAYSRDFQPAV